MIGSGRDPLVDPTVGNMARVWDHLLGGKDNFPADRELAGRLCEWMPDLPDAALAARMFLEEAITLLAQEGIDQFLDIGSGLPTRRAVHQVAQGINPEARVVYVDKDEMVLCHGRALLDGPGSTIVDGDLAQPETILDNELVAEMLDWGRPIAVILIAVLHFITDEQNPRDILTTICRRLPAGSVIVFAQACPEGLDPETAQQAQALYEAVTHQPIVPRSRETIVELLDGFGTWRPPGLINVAEWPTNDPFPPQVERAQLVGGILDVRAPSAAV